MVTYFEHRLYQGKVGVDKCYQYDADNEGKQENFSVSGFSYCPIKEEQVKIARTEHRSLQTFRCRRGSLLKFWKALAP